MLKNPILVAAAVILFATSSITADLETAMPKGNNNTLSISSDSLGPMTLDQNIKLMMRDGVYVEGKVVQASQDSITLKVKKSEPRNRFKGREAVIATSDIGAIYLRKGGTIAAPIGLGVAGGFLGTMLTALAGRNSDNPAYLGVVIAGAVGGSVGGALLGREAVKKTIAIKVSNPREP